MKWHESYIENKCDNPLKITGTRFASVLGVNKWSTPFKTWCEITRTYKEPFVGTIYTEAGKIIEPKQAKYIEHMGLELAWPQDVYGDDYFSKTHGDFFPENEIFGGMWDYLLMDDGKPSAVLEMKTTKRVEDWADEPPIYYQLQAALYAWLLGLDDVYLVGTFLADKDYENPDAVVVSNANTIVYSFKISEKFPNFVKYMSQVEEWWGRCVVGGVSPVFDEKADADILKELRTLYVDLSYENPDEVIAEIERLKQEIEDHHAQIKDTEKRYKALTSAIKDDCSKMLDENTDSVVVEGDKFNLVTSVSERQDVDFDQMKADGVYDKYVSTKKVYKINVTKRKDA